MSQDWIVEILTDIRKFAHKEGMLTLAETLDDAIIVAAREIRAHAASCKPARNNDRTPQTVHRDAAEREQL